MQALTPTLVHEVLRRFFPAQNDDFPCGYGEELQELKDFGIVTETQLVSLLEKRTEEVMAVDRSALGEDERQMHTDTEGEEFVARRLRAGFWFSFPALLRIALELEYGDTYKKYADRRDGVA